ncbi:(2Fe-2S)-binding protein [Leucobacter denitrificans]|uniref:(2Fe-2S)-binding protein n=1 Tax=Leucobacter denitrificans TaxID=683042 RepID=A0A7G9S3M5_9MICO|nr:(2Fe-2S)-binding protein [Leucobacter denitrificans]QNN62450.1 (2Fe-2S)-binding protein [Leucobacter denitrificans]
MSHAAHSPSPQTPQASQRVRATFDGEPIETAAGSSIAAALTESGCSAWRTTANGKQRGLFCGIGICFDCIVEVDGESGQRACMIPLEDGMDVRPQRSRSSAPPTGDATSNDSSVSDSNSEATK